VITSRLFGAASWSATGRVLLGKPSCCLPRRQALAMPPCLVW